MTKLSVDEMVEQFRSQFPDLTSGEEDAIRRNAETGGLLVLRCNFLNDPFGVYLGGASELSKTQWQQIDTAPKDGTEVDLWCLDWEGVGERWCRARWDLVNEHEWIGPWSDGHDCSLSSVDERIKPTHWMMPPPPPQS